MAAKPKVKAKAKAKGTTTKAKKTAAPKEAAKAKSAASARAIANEKAILNIAARMKETKSKTDRLRGDLGEDCRDASDKGVNLKVLKGVVKLETLALNDPIKAAIDEEDREHYKEVLGVNKLLAKSMFPASETRSGKKRAKPEEDDAQMDLQRQEADAEADEQPTAAEGGDNGFGPSETAEGEPESAAVH